MILLLDRIGTDAEARLQKLSGRDDFGFCYPISCQTLGAWQTLLSRSDLKPNYQAIGIRGDSQIDEASAKFLAEYGITLIVRFGSGVNNIDHLACAKYGIVVENVAGQNANGVAELVFGMIFTLKRHLKKAIYQWPEMAKPDSKFLHGQEISGKTMGIIGTGWIGSLVAQKASALGMKVIAVERDPQKQIAGVEYVTVQELCKRSDVISIHVPKAPENESLIGQAEVKLMANRSSILINCARPGLVDLDAVEAALSKGQLGGYASDVDDPNHPIFSYIKTLLTSHIGAKTEQSESRCALAGADQAYYWLTQGRVINGINVSDTTAKEKTGRRIVILNRDEPGAVAKITGCFAERNLNIGYIENRGHAQSKLAITLVELDSPFYPDFESGLIENLLSLSQVVKVYFV